MSFASALDMARKRPKDADLLSDLARTALAEGEEAQALPQLEAAVPDSANARLWQWKGLLERALDEHERALASFQTAARLAPTDASIAHGLARVALEAGTPSEHLFEQAWRLAPSDGSVLLGLAAARLAAGRAEQAEAELDAAVRGSPLWVQGHRQLAQLRSMLGKGQLVGASLERALAEMPDQTALWQALFELRAKSESFSQLDADVNAARRTRADPALLRMYEAIAAAELGEVSRADGILASMDRGGANHLPLWLVRHLLRNGRMEQALSLIDDELTSPRSAQMWPYAAVAWRASGDERWDWLNVDANLVSVVDLRSKLPPLDRLTDLLRSIHTARGEYLDQSLRGGTQTDGPLFSRIEPEIRAVRSAVVDAVQGYIASLPRRVEGHPLLGPRRDRRIRFAGSWSVRLREKGFHVSHVHPEGWISSALYIAVPPEPAGGGKEGWLQIGRPRNELGVELEPIAHVRPEPGRLVLFPSWMWHGTNPFPAGERISVAFDVAPPH